MNEAKNNAYLFVQAMSGYTFTPEEAKEIKEHVDRCTHPGPVESDKWNDAKPCGLSGNWCFVHHCYPNTCKIMGLGEYSKPSAPATAPATVFCRFGKDKNKHRGFFGGYCVDCGHPETIEPSPPAIELCTACHKPFDSHPEPGLCCYPDATFSSRWSPPYVPVESPCDRKREGMSCIFKEKHWGDCAFSPVESPKRCEICDWPLKERMEDGCIEGNCSYRPHEGTAEYYKILKRRQKLKVEQEKEYWDGEIAFVEARSKPVESPAQEAEMDQRADLLARFLEARGWSVFDSDDPEIIHLRQIENEVYAQHRGKDFTRARIESMKAVVLAVFGDYIGGKK